MNQVIETTRPLSSFPSKVADLPQAPVIQERAKFSRQRQASPQENAIPEEIILGLKEIVDKQELSSIHRIEQNKMEPSLARAFLLRLKIKYNDFFVDVQKKINKPKREKRPRRNTRTGAKYLTLKRQALLNCVIEHPNEGATFYAEQSRMSRSRCSIALNDLAEQGFLDKISSTTQNVFTPTTEGRNLLLKKTTTFWQCSITNLKVEEHCQNVVPPQMSMIIECAQSITKKLLKLGWYHRIIKIAIEKCGVSEILSKIQEAEKRGEIKKKGAWLYRVLVGSKDKGSHRYFKSLENSIRIIGEKVLEGFTEDVRQAFQEASPSMDGDFDKIYRLAYSIRKAGLKERTRWGTEGKTDSLSYKRTIGRQDVFAIEAWMKKQADRVFFAKRKGV